MNAPTHYRGREASRRSPKNAAVFFSLRHTISSELQVKFFVNRVTSWSIFMMYNTFIIDEINQHGLHIAPTLTCFFRPWLGWKLPLWRLLFCFGIITVNPWFVTSNNLFDHIFIISDHFQVVLSYFAFSALPWPILWWISHTRESFPNSRLELSKHKFLEFQDHFLIPAQSNADLL